MIRTAYRSLEMERHADVLALFLNRPGELNAVDASLHAELSTVFREVGLDPTVKAVVLTGRGPNFCAGGDLRWFESITSAELDRLFDEARRIIVDLVELPQPIVAAVDGCAVGLGATLALFCDMVLASETASFSDPHVRVGVTAGDGGAVIWPMLVGLARAKEFLMTGDTVSATQAHRLGLVNRVVARESLQQEALGTAARLARLPGLAVRSTKAVLNKPLREAVNLSLDTSLALERQCFATPEHRAAVERFLQRSGHQGGRDR